MTSINKPYSLRDATPSRLQQLHEATLRLLELLATHKLEEDLLQKSIEALTTLIEARYGAIGILDEAGRLRQFVHTGIAPEEAKRIGHLPEGCGLLGAVVHEDQVLRLDDMSKDPRSAGFPPNHPPMKSLLAAPISHQGQVYGRVYLSEKIGGEPFNDSDEILTKHYADALALVLAYHRSQTERRRAEEMLRETAQALSAATGDEFFPNLVLTLSRILGVDYALVGEIKPGQPDTIGTIAFCNHDRIISNIDYHVAPDTPCGSVECHAVCHFPEDAHKLFPEDDLIYRYGVEAFIGHPLLDSTGRVIGLLVAMHEKPIADKEHIQSLLQICAGRATAELERRRIDRTLNEVAQAVSSVTGEEFFKTLVLNAAKALQVEFAFVGELISDKADAVSTVAVSAHGRIVDNFVYELRGTPCRNVVGKVPCQYPSDIQQQFPEDHMLAEMGIESYVGYPLFDSAGRPLGLLVVMDSKPSREPQVVQAVLQICASRAAAELERRRTEETMRESEERFRATFSQAAVGIAHVAPNGRWLRVNQKLCEIIGYTEQELLSRTFQDITHPDDLEADLEYVQQVLAGAIPMYSMEKRYFRKDRSIVWIYLTVSLVRDEQGNPKYFISVVEDISARKQAEEAQRRGEENLRALAENANDGILVNSGGRHVFANQRLADMLGYSLEQLQATGLKDLVHPDEYAKVAGRFRERMAGKTVPLQYETVFVSKSGVAIPVEISATKTVWHGQPAGLVFIRDISARKQSEAQMLKLSSVVEQTADSVLITDRDGVIQYVNPAYEAITGYTWEDAVGKKPNIVKSGNHDEAFYERLWSTILRGEVFRDRFINRKKDGSLYYEEKTITPLKNEKGDITHFVSTGKDVTARVLAEEENRRTQAFLDSVVENLPNMLFVKDAKDLRFVRFNKAAEELLGYSRDEMLGKNDHDFFTKEEADFFTSKDRQVLNGDQIHDIPEEPIHTRHKGVRLLHTQKIPILDESGKPLYLLGISEDITERKTAEDMLARLGRILDSSSNEIYVFCADSLRFIQVNQGAQRNLGYNMEELRSLTPLDLKPGFTKQDFEVLIAPLRRGEQDTVMFETVHKRKDGSLYQVEVRLQLFRNETPPVFVAIIQDITERMRAMEALRASERRYQTMTEISPVGIFHTDVDGNCLYVNERWCAITGLSIEQARGTAWANALHPEDRERVFAEWNRAVNDHALFYAEYRFKRSDGTVTWVLGQARAETDGAGKIIGYVGTITDITERKRAEKALAQSAAEWTYSMDFIEDAMYLIDTDDKIVRANRAFYQLTGLSPDQTIGHDITSIMHPQGEPTPCRVCQARHARRDCHIIMEPQDPDNPTGHPIEVTMRIIRDAAGTPTGVLMDIRDLTPIRETERVLRESEAGLSRAQRIARLGNWDWNIVTNNLRWSDEIYRIFGLTPQQFDATYEAFLNSVHPDDRQSVTEALNKALNEKAPYSLYHRIVLPDGTERIVHEQAEVTFDENDKPIRMVGTVQDVTEFQRAQERLNYLAHYDTLTGLPNRLLLQDRLNQAMFEADRRDRVVAVMFLDLDRFKIINDTLGHDVGDALLKSVAERLTTCVRAGDTISRLGGDEFTIILANVAHVDDVARVAQKIIDSFAPPFNIAGRELFMSTSIGITLYPFDDDKLDSLL
ncbi:MAG: PAS domain S-box protein, partial [Sulfuricaulis sp.]|nr:PAS domain S-box protein [Sulfuricaulis sp.]